MEWPARTVRAFEHYGIDHNDPKYLGGRAQSGGWCSACHGHSVSNPFQLCDLEIARREDIREHGFDATHCAHCREAYPAVLDRHRLCPSCYRNQQRRDEKAALEAASQRRGLVGLDGGVRVPDGVGCTEKIPAWMVDWDGGPGAGGSR